MAERTYLVCSDYPKIYPSYRWQEIDRRNYLLEDSYAVPLLWLALFRVEDLKRQKVSLESDSPPVVTIAPVVETSVAIVQLQQAATIINSAFATNGPVDTYVDYLIDRLSQSGGRFVTAEWIEVYDENPEFLKYVKRILQFFSAPETELPILQQIEADRNARNAWPLAQKLSFLRQQVHERVSLSDMHSKLREDGGDIELLLKRLEQDGYYEPPRFQAKNASTRDMIGVVSGIRWNARFVPLLEGRLPESATEDEYWNHTRLIGEELYSI